ncbi:glycoside hydrolase [Sulfurimonas sp. CS5]|uniref:glycoside hydrolase n=1 Tax=Sulfurimonas sp. CS5 TaxID=3391145 RepID=UPI0039E876AE
MNKTLKLSFLWHMHQPDYRDSEGIMKMPWVFLHAIKDYYDMPWMLSKFSKLKATFNLTPSLIEQLNLCSEPLKYDYFFQLYNMHPLELSSSQREWFVKICKSPNYDTVIKPMPRFNELYYLESFSDEELIDLQMQFLLAWCGNYLRLNNETVKVLFQKERDYSSEDKTLLLDTLSAFIGEILPFYTSLLKRKIISISTTPYFHPILPLLIDMDNVQKANIHTKTPQNPLSFKDDAIKHVKRAKKLYKETFGVEPVGFWPAEGAVDVKSIEIYKNEGIKWIATDEDILFKSLGDNKRANLYKPYQYNEVFIAFRDHAMSDLIGFDYRFRPASQSVEQFISAIAPLASEDKQDTLFIILDGENAWEYYKDNAYPFFMKLYEKLSDLPWCKTICMDELIEDEALELENLKPGSWISGDFSTWVGHPDKNRAWELLFQARRDYDNYTHEISDKDYKTIENHFLTAQCSDWFWWYGDEHFTEFAAEFDMLFRKHLISIYELLNMQPPEGLFEPIIKHKSGTSFILKPQAHIYPKIDGKSSSFFEWIGCGSIDENRIFSNMERTRGAVEKIRFGHNEDMVYIAFDADMTKIDKEKTVLEIIIEELSETISLNLNEQKHQSGIIMSVHSSIEIALAKTVFEALSIVHLRFKILKEGKVIQTLPGCGALELQLDEDYSDSWFV